MKKLRNKLFMQDWMKLQPYNKPASEDSYFLGLANEMLELIDYTMKNQFSTQTKQKIALSVTAYFQDIISGFGLWNGFTNKHFSMYGKYLPFYELSDEYTPEEINPEDICFIIWSIAELDAKKERGTFLNPENPGIILLGTMLFKTLDDEYETAPESDILRTIFTEDTDYDDLYSFREVLAWLYSYLISPFTEGGLENLEEERKKMQKTHAKSDVDTIMYTMKYEDAIKNPCGPLALKTYEWLAAIIGEKTKLGKMLLQTQFRFKIPKSYLIKDEDKTTFTLMPFDSNELIKLQKDSLQKEFPSQVEKDAVLCNLIFYNGKWQLTGFIMLIEKSTYEKDRKEEEENRLNKEEAKRLFQKANKNRLFHFSEDYEELVLFMKKIFENTKEVDMGNEIKEQKYFVTYFDENNGLISIPDMALYIKDKNNPYYNDEECEENGFSILDYEFPKQTVEYLVKNNCLPELKLNSLHGTKKGKKQVQENLDFIFRFFQPYSFK